MGEINVPIVILNVIILILLFAVLRSVGYRNITSLPKSVYDEADRNCSFVKSSNLVPLRILQNNIIDILELLQTRETAWIGGEKYKLGCENKTANETDRICNELLHNRLPETFELNYTCVKINGKVSKNKGIKNFNNATDDCLRYGGTLSKINSSLHSYNLTEDAYDKGNQWYSLVDTKVLKDRLIRSCQFVRKIDECKLRVEYGNCKSPERKGMCFTEENMQFQSSLTLTKFQERDVDFTTTKYIISEERSCRKVSTTMLTERTTPNETSTKYGIITVFIIVGGLLVIVTLCALMQKRRCFHQRSGTSHSTTTTSNYVASWA